MRTRQAVRTGARAKERRVLTVAQALLAAEGRRGVRPARVARAAGVTRSWVAQYLGDRHGIQKRLAEVAVADVAARLLGGPASLSELADLLSGPHAIALSLAMRYGLEDELESLVLPYLQDALGIMLRERRVLALSRRVWAAWAGVLLMRLAPGAERPEGPKELLEIVVALAAAHRARSSKTNKLPGNL